MFYISWGTKSFQKAEGIAADFCPICRRASVVEVRQIRSQGHVYNIGLGQGDLVGHLCKCLTCGTDWAVQAGTVQKSVSPSANLSLEALLTETFPRFSLIYGERLEQEAALRRNPFALDPQTRVNLLAEPFFVLNNEMQRDDVRIGWFGGATSLGCIGSLGFAVATLVAFSDGSLLAGIGWLIIACFLGWLTLRSVTLTTGQLMRKRIYPRLALCLAPLLPSSDELTQVISHIKNQCKCANDTRMYVFFPLLLKASISIETAQAQAAAQAR